MGDTKHSTAPTNFVQTLNPFQRKLVATALALLAAVVIVVFSAAVFLILKGFVSTFSGVLWPLAVAGILALILRPVVQTFETRLKLGRTTSIIALYALVVLVLVAISALVLPVFIDQTLSFVEKLPTIWKNVQVGFVERYPQVIEFLEANLGQDRLAQYQASLTSHIERLLGLAAPAAQDLISRLSGIISLATGLAILPVYLFFFLQTDRDPTNDLDDQLSFLKDEWREDIVFLMKEFAASMVAFFRGQILIGLIMGVLLAIGFSVGGVSFGIFLGLFIGALNIIPYLGTIFGLGTVLPIAYLQPDGGLTLMLIALGVFFVVQLIEGYVLTPRIMGKQTGLHPLTIIIAIFFWGVALNGILGMILAIPLTAFFVVAWRLLKRKYLRPTENDPKQDTPVETIEV
jgi:predicted PurR-regulated permease PerM|tara:strand:+ start:4644 stop:5852 length:1209 start_codon:yes stop_codon:yes gene_type:complete